MFYVCTKWKAVLHLSHKLIMSRNFNLFITISLARGEYCIWREKSGIEFVGICQFLYLTKKLKHRIKNDYFLSFFQCCIGFVRLERTVAWYWFVSLVLVFSEIMLSKPFFFNLFFHLSHQPNFCLTSRSDVRVERCQVPSKFFILAIFFSFFFFVSWGHVNFFLCIDVG